jgi:hypothetical protein
MYIFSDFFFVVLESMKYTFQEINFYSSTADLSVVLAIPVISEVSGVN